MADLPRSHVLIYAAALVAIAVLGARQLGRGSGGREDPAGGVPPPAAIRVQQQGRGSTLVVHVAGAVRRPGVYRLRPGSRVDDAVRRAGGATRRADLAGLNLAAKIEDGRQVLVPARAARALAAAGGATGPVGAGPLNLNTATLEQLDTLDGVGPATARKILERRETTGGFRSVDELADVPGIGAKRLAALKEQVTV